MSKLQLLMLFMILMAFYSDSKKIKTRQQNEE